MVTTYTREDAIDIINWIGDNFRLQRTEGPNRYFKCNRSGQTYVAEQLMSIYDLRFIEGSVNG